ncbi:hypothetical protein PINS_up022697 [Pythium insidiosum]|nr:hypothetical protein PINS_up022697 [Pythium insidiosum]
MSAQVHSHSNANANANTSTNMETLLWQMTSAIPSQFSSPRSCDDFLDEEMRCGYTSKRCENPRTTKKGGGLHRFCEFHRRRANKNQWRVDNKRRLMRSQLKQLSPGAPYPVTKVARRRSKTIKTEVDEWAPLAAAQHMPMHSAVTTELSASDIAMLEELLFDDEDDATSQPEYFGAALDMQPTSPTTLHELHQLEDSQVWVV